MSKVTLTRDDLTGIEISDAGKPTAITVNGTKYERDMSDISVKALTALLTGDGSGLADMLSVYRDSGLTIPGTQAPATGTGTGRRQRTAITSGSAGKSGIDYGAVRAWLHSSTAGKALYERIGKPDSGRGRVAREYVDGWEAAGSPAESPAASPASTSPASTSTAPAVSPAVSPASGKTV